MRGSRFLCLAGILLLVTKSCNGLCVLENGTMARCHDLTDINYIDTYDLEILKTSVSKHRLSGEIFQNFVSLQNLELSHGAVEEIKSDTFEKLLELRSLDLSHNKLSKLPSGLFNHLKKLRNLNIRRNDFTDIPSAVKNIESLKSLHLIGNPLNCDCANLKVRDVLVSRGVHLSKRILCASPINLKSKSLLEPDTKTICVFEQQDKEMQMDQPKTEDSGQSPVVPPHEDPAVTSAGSEAPESAKSNVSTVPSSQAPSSEEMFFSEENASMSSTAATNARDETDDIPKEMNEKESLSRGIEVTEGSGQENDMMEGSGIEGSGIGIVPPISWGDPEDETVETSSSEPAKTTDAGLLDMIWDALWSTAAPEEDTKKELAPEDEDFINVSPSAVTPVSESPSEKIVVPLVKSSGVGSSNTEEGKAQGGTGELDRIVDNSNLGKGDDSSDAEATDASATRQPQKGMGSYVVLAALLAVLGVLIGFAAYKGDFCRKKRKRNDPERGTELRDMTKAFLEPTTQPKISSNGNLENVPLVCTPPPGDSTTQEQSDKNDDFGRYSAVPDVIDPIKPPRKSYGIHDEPESGMTNGKSQQDPTKSVTAPEITEPANLRNKFPAETPTKTHRDSLSSYGTESARNSPSVMTNTLDLAPTNGSHGTFHQNRPPLSPGAQRVKITLQDNPDSVPKTPILITRTKAGENLVKTP